jgi:hypothetical protein
MLEMEGQNALATDQFLVFAYAWEKVSEEVNRCHFCKP